MKMNKTEKLLAARKKLKEYKLHKEVQHVSKTGHVEGGAIKQSEEVQNEVPSQVNRDAEETSGYSQNNGSQTTVLMDEGQMSEATSGTVPSTVDIPCVTNVNSFTEERQHAVYSQETTNNHVKQEKEIVEVPPPANSVPFIPENDRNEVHTISQQSNEYDLPSSSAEPYQNAETSFHEIAYAADSPSLQKEHLLQMTSAVADALKDDSECDQSEVGNSDLEYRNQFLASCLQEQKQLVNQLHVQVSQYSSRVSELEAILATKEAEYEAKLLREVNPLKEQLQIHAQTTGILVGEKAELTAAVSQSQASAKQKAAEVEDLSGKLRLALIRVSELEKELSFVKSNSEDTGKVSQQLQNDFEDLQNKYSELRKEKEDLELETSECRQKLIVKNTELMSIQQQLQEKTALLSLNELRMQQMVNSPEDPQSIEGQHHVQVALEQQLAQLRETLKIVSEEKDESSKQYQNYVKQLDARQLKLVSELEAERKKAAEIETREQSYIQRLSELEKQLQSERETAQTLMPLQSHTEEVDALRKSIDALTLERDSLRISLSEKDGDIEILKKELQELQEAKEANIDAAKLASALESERLGASRAVSQNQQLKHQLNEMHDAFVLLSNTKLDLTEQLQAERNIGRKLNAHLNKIESEMEELKKELQHREAALNEMEKEKLHAAQIADQMQHYQAQSQNAGTLQQELQKTLETIESLKKENQQLLTQVNSKQDAIINSKDCAANESVNYPLESKLNGEEEVKPTAKTQNEVQSQDSNALIIPKAMEKLEERFKETMEKVAELSDEKQRLEHLVLQLQGETETIGEYITLYQKQRRVLQERAREKEQEFSQLVEQRNEQQEQLHKLKVLVADLLNKSNVTKDAAIETTPVETHNDRQDSTDYDKSKENHNSEDTKNNTASQILDLLTEIKDCNDACISGPNFHPCPWCSGKLITV